MYDGGNDLTPTQRAAVERSKAFRAQIAEHAAKVRVPIPSVKFIPNVPFGVIKEAPPEPEWIKESDHWPQMWFHNLVFPNYRLPRELINKIELIKEVVAKHYDLTLAELIGGPRSKKFSYPRMVGMYLAKEITDRSLPDIGRRFGGRDHTTVLHGVRKIEGLLAARDPQMIETIAALEAELAR